MINKKSGSAIVANIISVIITEIIIIAVGIVYYVFFSPEELDIKKVKYAKLEQHDYAIDKEFKEGLDTTIDINYTDDELDMHRDLKDYYQGREDPFADSEDRNTMVNIDGEREQAGEKVTDSRPDLIPVIPDESEIDIEGTTESENNSSILNF